MNSALDRIRERVSRIVPVDAGHDFHHVERVASLAERILRLESLATRGSEPSSEEIEAVTAAALLHDCVPIAKNSPLRKESARLCAEKAYEWLTEFAWEPREWRPVIRDAILDHSFSGGRVPTTLVGQALQDADRLEALGALGLYRTIATGVSMGGMLFDPEDPWAERRELDDRRFTIDHFHTKLLKLPDTFRTSVARAEARRRAQVLEGFLRDLKHELSGELELS